MVNDKKAPIAINPYEHTVENLVRREASGRMSAEEKARHIKDAEYYAARNKRPFDGTFAGAMRLAAEADKVIRDHRVIADKLRRAAMGPRKVKFEGHEKGREFRGETWIN